MSFLEFRLTRLKGWWLTRPYRRFWKSLPALLAGVALAGIGLLLACHSSPAVTDRRYAALTEHALATRSFETARVACMRRLSLGVASRPEIMFKLSLALNGLGRSQDALGLLNELAPTENPGYAPAHLVLAQGLLNQKQLTAPAIRLAELHLAHARQLNPDSKAAEAMLKWLYGQMRDWEAGKPSSLVLQTNAFITHELAGWLYFEMQDWPAARPHLLAEVGYKSGVEFMLATVAQATGDVSGWQHWVAAAEMLYRVRVAQAKTDNPPDRLALVQAEVMQEKYDEALATLRVGQELSGTNIYSYALVGIYAAWAEKLGPEAPVNLEASNTRDSLLKQLDDLSRMQGPAAKMAATVLAKLQAEGQASPEVFTTMGTDAWQKGDLVLAKNYFTRAFELAPHEPRVANNLALILALARPPDLPRALQISQVLVDKFPDQPNFRDTHGQILVELGRWTEAVKDLEFALPRLQNPAATHLALAKAYRNLKRVDEAKAHEQLAHETAPPPLRPARSGSN